MTYAEFKNILQKLSIEKYVHVSYEEKFGTTFAFLEDHFCVQIHKNLKIFRISNIRDYNDDEPECSSLLDSCVFSVDLNKLTQEYHQLDNEHWTVNQIQYKQNPRQSIRFFYFKKTGEQYSVEAYFTHYAEQPYFAIRTYSGVSVEFVERERSKFSSFFFPGKPAKYLFDYLKSRGYRCLDDLSEEDILDSLYMEE